MVSLYAQGLITASEVKWLKSNLLSQSECDQLHKVEATVQTKLFNQDDSKSSSAVNSSSPIAVGNKVTIEDCPGHWSWASPFTVQEIKGNLVKLEMVNGSVEIERLNVIDG